jgi:Zn-dependent peptidase ImmA (M78 family)
MKYRVELNEDHDINNCSQEDLEATYFACALLVPEDKLRCLLDQTRDLSIIAKRFGVSGSAIRMRICFMRMR